MLLKEIFLALDLEQREHFTKNGFPSTFLTQDQFGSVSQSSLNLQFPIAE